VEGLKSSFAGTAAKTTIVENKGGNAILGKYLLGWNPFGN
jgi:hypothetical protein